MCRAELLELRGGFLITFYWEFPMPIRRPTCTDNFPRPGSTDFRMRDRIHLHFTFTVSV